MILFVKLTKEIGHKFYQLMKSSPIYTKQYFMHIQGENKFNNISNLYIEMRDWWDNRSQLLLTNTNAKMKITNDNTITKRTNNALHKKPNVNQAQSYKKRGWTHVLRRVSSSCSTSDTEMDHTMSIRVQFGLHRLSFLIGPYQYFITEIYADIFSIRYYHFQCIYVVNKCFGRKMGQRGPVLKHT
jgi:hypothetical protein